jgi:hypothetical protein
MEKRKRFYIALAVYAVLGLLAWGTLSNEPLPGARGNGWFGGVSLRAVTVAILALFAFRTVLHWKAEQLRETDEEP